MKNYDAYIFDFDYTLADATDPVVDSFTYALEKMNLKKAVSNIFLNSISDTIFCIAFRNHFSYFF